MKQTEMKHEMSQNAKRSEVLFHVSKTLKHKASSVNFMEIIVEYPQLKIKF